MRQSMLGLAILALVAVGAYVAIAGGPCLTPSASTTTAVAADECAPAQATGARPVAKGKIAGRFDSAMSGVCRFACATQAKFDAKSVLAQPGARAGNLTQCPVSGVVFAVDAHRPHVRVAQDDYVTCCDKCAGKLKRSPRRYLKA
jgi:hypothetical protein